IQVDPCDLDIPRVVDVIKVEEWKEAWIRASALEVILKIDAFQLRAEECRREAAHPLVEVADDNLGAGHVPLGHDACYSAGLVQAFENRGAEMDVVDMQQPSRHADVHPLHVALPAVLPREIVLHVAVDRKAAENHIAELVAAYLAR